MNALALSVLRELSDGRFHSGTVLAQKFGCSRASVWQAVEWLTASLGVVIYRVRGQGYRLPQSFAWLTPEAIRAHLRSEWQTEVADVIDSTNSALLTRAAQGAPHRLALFAEWQYAGRGRQGRAWQVRLGGALTFSVLWRFECGVSRLSGLSLVVGIVLARVLRRFGVPVVLKWPNDILLNDKKLAGILIELSGDAIGPSAVVIGIGLNVLTPYGVEQPAVGLEGYELPARAQLAAAILDECAEVLPRFAHDGFRVFQAEWERYHAWQGQVVQSIAPHQMPRLGLALGVDVNGALRLQMPDGEELRIHSGEVSVRTVETA